MDDQTIERVAKAIFKADDMAAKPDFAWGDTTAASYRAMAIAAIDALGLHPERYRSVNCPDDRDYDMARLASDWRPE